MGMDSKLPKKFDKTVTTINAIIGFLIFLVEKFFPVVDKIHDVM